MPYFMTTSGKKFPLRWTATPLSRLTFSINSAVIPELPSTSSNELPAVSVHIFTDEPPPTLWRNRSMADFPVKVVIPAPRYPLPPTVWRSDGKYLPRYVPLFRFPNSSTPVGTLFGQPALSTELRHHWNRRNGVPWDTPIFPGEVRAVKQWEKQWGETFLPGENMAVWDSDRLSDRNFVAMYHGRSPSPSSDASNSTDSASDSGDSDIF